MIHPIRSANRWVLHCVLCLTFLSACSNTYDVHTILLQQLGSFTGTVHLGIPPYTSDQSGTLVQLEGTSLQGTTNADGVFTIDSIPSGSYTVVFSHPGYSSVRWKEYQFVGPGTTVFTTSSIDDLKLYPLNSITVRSFTVDTTVVQSSYTVYRCHVVADSVVQHSVEAYKSLVGILTDTDPHLGTPSVSIASRSVYGFNDLEDVEFAFYPGLDKWKRLRSGTHWYLTLYSTYDPASLEDAILSNSVQVVYP